MLRVCLPHLHGSFVYHTNTKLDTSLNLLSDWADCLGSLWEYMRKLSDGFYMERAERSLQAPLKNVAKQPPSKKCREASTTKKCHKAAHPKKCRKESRLKISSKCSPSQKCCEAALQKVTCYV